MSFLDDLRRYGPDLDRPVGREEALAYCDALTRSHYENFSVVTRLTPRELRPAFAAVYAFCRWSDDLGDEIGDRDESRRLLAWWRGELAAMYRGETRHPVFVALADVVSEFAIPIDPFSALISAFEQDQEVANYSNFDQLLDYCRRSANPVGHLVLYLGRSFEPTNAALSDETCTGLQLANFWQDVARDLEIGRIYLPKEDRERFGVSEMDLRERRFTPQYRSLLEIEVSRARGYLLRGRPLIERLPRALAVDVDLFNRGGMAILDRIAARNFDTITGRPEVSKAAKVGLLLRALIGRMIPGKSPSPIAVPTGGR